VRDIDDPWLWELRPKAERQMQTQAVDAADLHFRILGPDDDDLLASEVEKFLHQALARSAFHRPNPVVLIDLDQPAVRERVLEQGAHEEMSTQQFKLAGLVRDGVIHLDPTLLGKRTALHELAHYIAPRASHGPVWCRVFVDLVTVELGPEAGSELLSQLEENGATVARTLG
jgi:hypothetical protein